MIPARKLFSTWRFRAIISISALALVVTVLPSSASTVALGRSPRVRAQQWTSVTLNGVPNQSQVSIALTANSNAELNVSSREDSAHQPRLIKKTSLGTYTSFPIADAYVTSNRNGRNFGDYGYLRLDNRPDAVAFLRFNLPVTADDSATYTIQVWAHNSHRDGFDVYLSQNNWSEYGVNYDNQPDLISANTQSPPTGTSPTVTTNKPTTTVRSTTTSTRVPTTVAPTTVVPTTTSPNGGGIGSGAGLTRYPLHTNIASTIFWVGEIWNANAEDGSQVCSTYDSTWAFRFSGGINNSKATEEGCAGSPVGGCDGVTSGSGATFKCKRGPIRTQENRYRLTSLVYKDVAGHGISENSFYLDLPYDDLNNTKGFANRCNDIPWANDPGYAGNCTNSNFSYMKNRWVQLNYGAKRCYAQVQDAGPSDEKFKDGYYDKNYVFGTSQPLQTMYKAPNGSNAGMDVSPATYDCLGLNASGGTEGTVAGINWRFVDYPEPGPWLDIVTTSGVNN